MDRWVLGAAEGVGVGGSDEGLFDWLGGGGDVEFDDGRLEIGGMFAADGGDDQVVGVGCGEGEGRRSPARMVQAMASRSEEVASWSSSAGVPTLSMSCGSAAVVNVRKRPGDLAHD